MPDMNSLFVNSQDQNVNILFVSEFRPVSYNLAMENRLKIERNAKGMSQQELADAAGTSLRNVQYLEKGGRKLSPEWMEIFSNVLKIEPWMLWIDPKLVIDPEDYKLISHYHALKAAKKKRVDKILYEEE